ncbi:peptide chain release factor N(5)-glutamine methyltransferase [Aureimonas fodinaquatilis]|uniref:peptide chain release factor N(5)-glutamine methyltransferase n=1 Tax=Aureimonas fodinaquatilis TaxID=2565783 RepID=A0A5B0DQX3_9HYPH|nr:peptide chain release factor N(5)-glutamine methyltransferase [Aureimonas fodinaquatilis]KAA0968868.1 peptide chain release factor N(5)-glutamine methyltransferase [Aureimonas fodinaquatilis]
MPETTVGQLLRHAQQVLAAAGVATGGLDARLLVMETLGLSNADLILRAEAPVPSGSAEMVSQKLARRCHGEPVHRILGHRPFHALDFILSADTLEPRPDTEALVDLAARAFERRFGRDGEFVFADIGVGSGAVAVSLLGLFARARAVAVDISAGALATASLNAARAGVEDRFLPVRGNYLDAICGPVDAIVSNPPYIPTHTLGELDAQVRNFDPILALDGGLDGLVAYRAIASALESSLSPQGDVLLEIGFDQQQDVTAILDGANFRLENSERDLGGHIRALWFRRN